MKIPVEVRQAHDQLSKANGRFLEYVQQHPELLERSTFQGIEHLEELGGYPLQAWPTFISSRFMSDIHRWNKVLCHLAKVMPHRVLGNSVEGFAKFYEITEDHAQLVLATYAQPRWIEETISRGDFMLTADGFKCMEYNLSSRLGGWHSSWATDGLLEIEPVRRFVESAGLKVRRGSTFKTLMGYLVKRVIQRFASKEVNIVAFARPGEVTMEKGQIELVQSMERELQAVESLLGGKVTCRLLQGTPEQLEERGGYLYLGEHRVHAVLEGAYGNSGLDAMRCWLKGTVDLYNGPATPVLIDKRNLALISELEDSSLLSDDERKVVKAHLPWTRRVSTERLHDEAVAPVPRQEFLRRREELVLKPSDQNSGGGRLHGAPLHGARLGGRGRSRLRRGQLGGTGDPRVTDLFLSRPRRSSSALRSGVGCFSLWRQGRRPLPAPRAQGRRRPHQRPCRRLLGYHRDRRRRVETLMNETKQRRGMGLFLLIWSGYFVSTLGSGLIGFALGVTVFQDTGSVSRFTLIGLSSLLPTILLSPVVGVLADRIDRRLILIFAGLGAAGTNWFLYLLTLEVPLNIWKVYPLILITSCFNAFVWPTFAAATTLMVDKDNLGRASGLTQIGESVSAIIAPTLAAVLMIYLELSGIVLLNLVSYLVPTIILILVRLQRPKESEEGKKARGSFFKEAMSGWHFIYARKGFLWLLISFAMVNLFMAFVTVLLTPLVLSFASPMALGLVLTVASAGSLVGGIVMAVWGGPRRNLVKTIFGLVGYCSILLLMAGMQPNPILIACGAFFFVLVFPIIAGCTKVIWQSRVPPDVQGRVFAMRRLIAGSTTPLALILAGPLADEVFEPMMSVDGALAGSVGELLGVGPGRGIGLMYVIFAIILMILVVAAFRSRALMNLEDDLPEVLDEDEVPSGFSVDAMEADAGLRSWRPALGWGMAALLAGLSVVALWAGRPPAVEVDADPPPTEVSIAAVLEHVEVIAQEPHPLGSVAHGEVLDYLSRELDSMGLEYEIQEADVRSKMGRLAQLVSVKNLVARVPGSSGQRDGAILLAAHYDSVATSPGACDNGTAVGVLLETARALLASEPLKRDVILFFPDAEETGLHGARAFVAEHPWARDVGVVLNFDARGHGGPVYMFQTGPDNGAWISTFADLAPLPAGSSLMNEIYNILPNLTDFKIFQESEFAGFNFAYIDGLTHYHTMLDRVEDVEPATVAHQATYALDLTRGLGNLETFPEAKPDGVFFNPLGFTMVHYPRWFAFVSAILTGLLVIWVLAMGLRSGRLTPFGLGQGIIAFLGIFIALPVAITLVWLVVRQAASVTLVGGSTEMAAFYMVGFACLSLALFLWIYRFFRQAVGALDLAAGTMVWWLVLLVVTTEVSLPAQSNFIIVWPLLFSALALFGLLRLKPGEPHTWPLVLSLAAAAVVGILLMVPLQGAVYVGLQSLVALGGFPLIVQVLLLGLLMPQLETFVHRRPKGLVLTVAGIGLAVLVVAVWNPGGDRSLKINSVMYAKDIDTGQNHWFSYDLLPDFWTKQFGLRQSVWRPVSDFDPLATQPILHADAPKSDLPEPQVELLESHRVGPFEEWTVRFETRGQATSRLLWFEPPQAVQALRLGTTNLSLDQEEGGLVVQRLPLLPEGDTLTLRRLADDRPVTMVVVETHEGLPSFPGFEERPHGVLPSSRSNIQRSDISFVRRSFDLQAMTSSPSVSTKTLQDVDAEPSALEPGVPDGIDSSAMDSNDVEGDSADAAVPASGTVDG